MATVLGDTAVRGSQRYRALGIGAAVDDRRDVARRRGGRPVGEAATATGRVGCRHDVTTPARAAGHEPRTARTGDDGTADAATTLPAAPSTATTDPGLLPQTDAKPDASSAAFTAHVNSLWAAIVADDPSLAMPFFFPLNAYKQVKAISDPEGDWNTRLVAAFNEDIHAWHAQLGVGRGDRAAHGGVGPERPGPVDPARRRVQQGQLLARSTAPPSGTQVDGRAGTFTVASMISWRGEWYVVHLASIR